MIAAIAQIFNPHSSVSLGRKIHNFFSLVKNPPLMMDILLGRLRTSWGEKKKGVLQREIGSVKFEFDFDYASHVRRMYARSYEPIVVAAIKKILKKGDIFFDIGASIGYMSAVGADCVGPEGSIYSFEPSPREFKKLERLAQLNPGRQIYPLMAACGEDERVAKMDISNTYGWNTLVPDFMRNDVYQTTMDVSVLRLDGYILSNVSHPEKVALIKIDVEGFEYYVLKGLQRLFLAGYRPAIICEVTPRGNKLMGIPLSQIKQYMEDMGYETLSLIDFKSKIDLDHSLYQEDVLFRKM